MEIYAPGGKFLREGETIFNRDMADTFSRLSTDGLESFYKGSVAEAIIEGFGAKGLMTERDLRKNTRCEGGAPWRWTTGVGAYSRTARHLQAARSSPSP